MYKLLHFPAIEENISEYKDCNDFESSYKKYGCDGIEIICCGDYDQETIRQDAIIGVHLPFHSDWMSFWKGDTGRLDLEFGGRKVWEEFYGGTTKEVLIHYYKEGLDFAKQIEAKYVVFHVNNSTLEEVFTYQNVYSDEEVVDSAAEIINALLETEEYQFDFLMENLWLSGLNFKRPEITNRLFRNIGYSKKGFMVDLGHLMNTNIDLNNEEEAFDYIHRILDQHEQLLPFMKGIHLHQSVSGAYVKQILSEKKDFYQEDYYQRLKEAYDHLFFVDQHEVVLSKQVISIINRIDPQYLVCEFRSNGRKQREEKLSLQSRLWQK